MQDFRNLAVWRRAHELALAVYRETSGFPDSERFGLVNQMRRSAASIPTNIAEGCGRGSDADFARFLHMALGSASELEYQILLASDLGHLLPAAADSLLDQVQAIKKMASSLARKAQLTRITKRPADS
ncbi:four helix bundle protein [Geothrix alkalitolerans]|uniref:four helix bundle protein n=1 Tax=Geothrix alkalitolerans TaxID=2922724 RepID=UPI001FAF7B6F|nr:four helix bundle protein [Geothrix alkalitolerans]